MELSYAKEIVLISSAVYAQCTNTTDRHTDRPWNSNRDINRRLHLKTDKLKMLSRRCTTMLLTQTKQTDTSVVVNNGWIQ